MFTRAWHNHKSRNAAVYACLSTRNFFLLSTILYHLLLCPDVIYDRRYDELFEVPMFCIRHECLKQFGKSHYIYAEFVLKTYDVVTSKSIKPQPPTEYGQVAVIVEPRRHPLLEYTIKQVMATLKSEWSLQLFLSSENEQWMRERLQIYEGGFGENIVVTPLARFGLNEMHQYGSKVQSGFSAHQCLYEAILGEHILWFQVDVILRAGPQPEWLKYAYTGSEWHGCEYPTCSAKSCDKICGGGNSGLSLRRRSKLWAVATRGELPKNLWGPSSTRPFTHVSMLSDQSAYFESDEFRDNSVTRWFEDDLQISFKLSKLGLLSPGHVSRQFALSQALPKNESLRNLNPSGMHKPWTVPWIPPRVIMELLSDPFDRIMHSIDPFR